MRLRVLTWNIHKCIGGLDRRYRPERVEEVLRHYEADLLLLQEVDEGVRRSRRERQAERLAGALGIPHVAFFPNVLVRGGGAYGNAVLSRNPVAAAPNICLTYPGFKRGLFGGLFSAAGPPIVFHLYREAIGIPAIRAPLLAFFAVATLVRITATGMAGAIDGAVLAWVAAGLPAVLLGTWMVRRFPPHLPDLAIAAHRFRAARWPGTGVAGQPAQRAWKWCTGP